MSVNKVNKTTGDLSLLAGGTLFADNPIGSIIPYGGATAPAGWFICDGTELVRSTYPELFAVIGTSFGTPSDNTKFKLPDLRNKTTVGGGTLGTSSEGSLPNITGGDDNSLSTMVWTGNSEAAGALKYGTPSETYKLPGDGGLGIFVPLLFNASLSSNLYKNNQSYVEPANVRVNYIIKAVSVGIPADFMSAVDNAVDKAMSDIGTADITELSALANIGTAANATQHDVNVAIDSALEDNVRYSTSHGTDLDTLIHPGIYSVEILDITNQHAPTHGWMSLFISCWDRSSGYVQQLAIDVNGNIWFRMSDNTRWASWRQLAFQS